MISNITCHILLISQASQGPSLHDEDFYYPGIVVHRADTESDIISRLLEFEMSLIIVDPGTTPSRGIQTAALIRSSERLKQIPILFLLKTVPEPDYIFSFHGEGPVDYLITPPNKDILKSKIRTYTHLYILKKSYEAVQRGGGKAQYNEDQDHVETENALVHSKKELEAANRELLRLTEDLEHAISTANQMAVEAEIATISKSRFLASMSHEIRTPLNAVVGFTDLVLSTDLTAEQKEYIESIRSSSQTFLGLLNDILDFSKIEADRIDLENIPLNLEKIMEDVLNSTGIRAYEKHTELVFRIYPDVPRSVSGDPVRLKQILVNLVGNAIKFTEQGFILLRVTSESKTADKITLCFSVSDTGIGIPANKQKIIFDPFSQATESTTREFGGTGLGLAISRKLAELMNGEIRIESPNPESTDHPGTVFRFTGEFGMVEGPDSLADPPLPHGLKEKRIHVSVGNRTLREFYCDILHDAGMVPETQDDVHKIPDIFLREDKTGDFFPCLLLDDSLPVSAIYETVETVSSKEVFKEKIIVMVSPFFEISDSISKTYPQVSWIRKPFRLSTLKQVLTGRGPDTPQNNPSLPENKETAEPVPPLNILLVEDNKINQKVATKMLKKMGHTVKVADNGNDAIEILQTDHGIDLILMDGQMPVMDGFKATEIIRRKESTQPEKSRVPIIALTANAMKGDKDRFLKAGMDDYIAKPVKFDDLSSMISKIMTRKQAGTLVPQELKTDQDLSEF